MRDAVGRARVDAGFDTDERRDEVPGNARGDGRRGGGVSDGAGDISAGLLRQDARGRRRCVAGEERQSDRETRRSRGGTGDDATANRDVRGP